MPSRAYPLFFVSSTSCARRQRSGGAGLPLHSGGLGWCVRRNRSGAATLRTRDARPYGGIAAPMRSAAALRQRCLVCLRRGTFHRGKVPKTRRGLWPPDSRWAPRRASQETVSPGPLRSTRPSRSIPPPLPGFARASRIGGPLRLQNFSLRPHPLPRNRRWKLHTAAFSRKAPVLVVGAAISRPPG